MAGLEKGSPPSSTRQWGVSSSRVEVAELLTKSDFSLFFECPVCLDVPIPPVYLCSTGHIVCEICRKKVKACGLCGGPFPGSRNFFYENLFEKVSFLCRFASDGCTATICGKELKSHQEKCVFRPLPCIKYGCPNMQKGNLISFSKFVEHFTKVHDGKMNKTNSGKVCNGYPTDADSWLVSRWAHEVFNFRGYYFFATSQIRKPEVGIWLWMLGSDELASKFRVIIKLGESLKTNSSNSGAQKNVSLIWEGPVHSIRNAADVVMDSGDCFITSMNSVKSLCSVHQQSRVYWEVQFEIVEIDAPQNSTRTGLFQHVTSRRSSMRDLASPIPLYSDLVE